MPVFLLVESKDFKWETVIDNLSNWWHSTFLRITKVYPYASLTANYDNFTRATLTFVFLICNMHWASSQVNVVTEKHQTTDYPEIRPTFTAAELKDITEFQIHFKSDVILTSITIANEIILHESCRAQSFVNIKVIKATRILLLVHCRAFREVGSMLTSMS